MSLLGRIASLSARRGSRFCSSSASSAHAAVSAAAASTSASLQQPTAMQLRRHALTMAVPMVGFGFMDNLVMIQAGDLIDNSIGVTFGLATLTSAAYGQIVSDVSGTLSSGVVEAMAAKLGLPRANLSGEQMTLRSVQVYGTLGAVVGVACGCLLGMSCLMFMDLEKSERLKKAGELRTLYATLMEDGHNVIGAEHCALFLLDKSTDADGHRYLTSMGWKGKEPTREELKRTFEVVAGSDGKHDGHITPKQLYQALRLNGWTAELTDVETMVRSVDKDDDAKLNFEEFAQLMTHALLKDEVRLRVREGGSRHHVITTGQLLNIRNVDNDPQIDDESRRRYKLRGYDVRSLLLAPIFDADGEVIGLVELVNKDADAPDPRARPIRSSKTGAKPPTGLARRNSSHGFSEDDERLLEMLCTHCSVFLKHLDA